MDQPNPPHNPHAPQGHGASVSGRKALLFVALALLLAVLLAVFGILPRIHAAKKLQADTDQMAIPDVVVAKPALGKPDQEIVLPGNMYAYTDSPLYARTSGYLSKWYFDIGAHVRRGQLLAIIASPEVDQQLAQAQADLGTAQANAGNARIQANRYEELLKQNAVAKQDRDNFVTQQASTSTQVTSAQANVSRLQQLVGFEKIYAPFDGVLTARDVDIGTLIDAGANHELFHMADEHVLRVYINVPQMYSSAAIPGVVADLTLSEFPGRRFQGRIVRTARAIDPASRTLLVEVDVDNRAGQLFPGAYTEVHLKLNVVKQTMVVPVSTLMFRHEGLRIAIVTPGNRAKLIPITVGEDDGRVVQVLEGLTPDDEVIQNPPDSVIDGEQLRIVQPGQQNGNQGNGNPGKQGPSSGPIQQGGGK